MRNDELFAFAGLWERWQDENENAHDTFTIFTTDPNELLKPLHDRMPVILPPDVWPQWLDPDQRDAQALTRVPFGMPDPREIENLKKLKGVSDDA